MRGFVTVATGKEHYYKLAKNLLLSYKHNTKNPMPFAIITDKKNPYIDLFDKAVILENPHHSYLDKISMLYNPPFQENICIDADCIAYRDLNDFWEFMTEGVEGVTAPGLVLPIDSPDGFFEYESIGEYKQQVKYNIGIHGGIYYFKDDLKLKEQLKYMEDIEKHYYEYKFKYFKDPADEPIIALSMALTGVEPIKYIEKKFNGFLFYPIEHSVRSNVLKGKLSYKNSDNKRIKNVYLLHWTNTYTFLPQYKIEEDRLNNRSTFKDYKAYYKQKLQTLLFEDERFITFRKMYAFMRRLLKG